MENQFKLKNLIIKYKDHFESKYKMFEFLYDLKTNLEFNSSFKYPDLFKDLSIIYKDPKPLYNSKTFTPDPIDKNNMSENDVFVFGSNTEGRHGGGAAKVALDQYGAIYGQSIGLQGQSYAIVTKDLSKGVQSIELDHIEEQIEDLIKFALDNPDLTFWVTKIGCGLGGYSISDIAPLFANKLYPDNIRLPKEFVFMHYWAQYLYSPSTEKLYKLDEDYITEICANKNNMYILKYKKPDNIFTSLEKDIVISDAEDFEIVYTFIKNKI